METKPDTAGQASVRAPDLPNDITLDGAAALTASLKRVLVLSHAHPDSDTLGCAAALTFALRLGGADCRALCPDAVPDRLRYVVNGGSDTPPDLPVFLETPQEESEWTEAVKNGEAAAVSVDVAESTLFDRLGPVFCGDRPLIRLKLDHHPARESFAVSNYVDTAVGSCSEIVYELIRRLPWLTRTLPFAVAAPLYGGIISDTGNFRYPSVTARTHRIAAALIDAGVVHSEISERLFGKRSLASLSALKLAIDKLEYFDISPDLRVSVIAVGAADYAAYAVSDEELGELPSFARDIEGVEIGIVIRQNLADHTQFRISMRSGEANVGAICESLGGGGHLRASGASVSDPSGDIAAAKRIVLDAVKTISAKV